MATHFARGVIGSEPMTSPRLPVWCYAEASQLPEYRRVRYLASRTLLAELMFMLYGCIQLPRVACSPAGKPHFADTSLAGFSLSYAGNIVGVALNTEGICGLDIELQYPQNGHPVYTRPSPFFTRNELVWINNQSDPDEARIQLATLRQSMMKMIDCPLTETQRLQLQPSAGKLRLTGVPQAEALSNAEDVLVWSVTTAPSLEGLTLWEYSSNNGWKNLQHRETSSRMMRFTSMVHEPSHPGTAHTMNQPPFR